MSPDDVCYTSVLAVHSVMGAEWEALGKSYTHTRLKAYDFNLEKLEIITCHSFWSYSQIYKITNLSSRILSIYYIF